MGRSRRHPAVAGIDPEALAAFQAGIRKRYTNDEILAQLRDSAERLGPSPTMREFAADDQTTVHPQTVIEHFGSWNAATAGRARAEALRHARGAARAPASARRGARAHADRPRHRRLQGGDAVEVAPLAHLRLARPGAAGGRLRRPGGGGAARARGRAGSRAGAEPRPAQDGRLGRRPARRRAPADRVAGVPDDRTQPAWAAFQYLVRERLRDEGTDVAGRDARAPSRAARPLRGRSQPGAASRRRPRAARAPTEEDRLLDVRPIRPERVPATCPSRRAAASPRRPHACAA